MAIVEDFACTLCSCVCDDLRLTVEGDRIVRSERACVLAEPWLLSQDSRQPPVARIDGTSVALETAIVQAADLLARARYPLIFGMSQSSTEGQRAAVKLAESIGATIDTTASHGHGPSILAVQQVGESTCSLGEVKNRCDLVIFWGCNPVLTHPRHLERYSDDCAGLFVPGGRRDRKLIVVDVVATATSEKADRLIRVEPGGDCELLWALRGLIRGQQLDGKIYGGVPRADVEELCARLRGCRSGVVFFGFGLARQRGANLVVQALLQLVTDLNDVTRFYARRLRGSGDVTGADSVLAWQTGYPFSVNLSRGFPRYNPGEFSANDMLERGEPDVCVFVGSRGASRFTPSAMAHLAQIPTIVLDPPQSEPPFTPTVQFTTSVYGIHQPGTAYRMDEIPIPLRAVLPARYPTDEHVLGDIERVLRQRV
ncbi:MAG TPA: formylmethanofuran dehydrogenase subunit B [Planctomycetaceae bacterium]|jgi:formylmethanofuran dehydrogenase subunit B|nr:formylmethanofuran dehydrogenase subunit B [Planctomycetaceae bacterium]